MRRIIYLLFVASFFACKDTPTISSYDVIQGQTMGTYYGVSYRGIDGLTKAQLKTKVDSILFIINDEMSTYIDSSFISLFNKSLTQTAEVPSHFKTVLDCARKVHELSNSSFDPTVMPLTNYWGFGYSGKVAREDWDSTSLKQIVDLVGFDKVVIKDNILVKDIVGVELDFSALAKGYAVDVIVSEMQSLGIEHLLVDIGGDGFAKGKSKSGNSWRIGINVPDVNAAYTDRFVDIELDGKGLATSGNYRNYYEVDGELYGHTINTKTGFPFKSNVLSVSVIANTSMEADAWATACMASYLDDGIAMIEGLIDVEAYFIFEDKEGNMKQKYTAGFKDHILE